MTSTGISVGGFVEYPVTPMVSLLGEISYTMKGGKNTCTYEYTEPGMLANGVTFDETYKLNYIEVPMLLKINIPMSGNMMPYLLVGPGVAFNIGADYEETNGETFTVQ